MKPETPADKEARLEFEQKVQDLLTGEQWKADRATAERVIDISRLLLGRAVKRQEPMTTCRVLMATILEAVRVGSALPNEAKRLDMPVSDVIQLTPEEITARWKELV